MTARAEPFTDAEYRPGLPWDGEGIRATVAGYERTSGPVRMAYRLAIAYFDRMCFDGGRWYFWDGHRWSLASSAVTGRAVLRVLSEAIAEAGVTGDVKLRADVAKCESARGIAGVLSIASSLDWFDREPCDREALSSRIYYGRGTKR